MFSFNLHESPVTKVRKESQRGQESSAIHLRSHSLQVAEPGFKLRKYGFRVWALHPHTLTQGDCQVSASSARQLLVIGALGEEGHAPAFHSEKTARTTQSESDWKSTN